MTESGARPGFSVVTEDDDFVESVQRDLDRAAHDRRAPLEALSVSSGSGALS